MLDLSLQTSFSETSFFPEGEIFPYFQPIVSLESDGTLKIKSFEALARMRPIKEDASVQMPSEFIHKIQKQRLMHLDLHMFEHACRFAKRCQDRGIVSEQIPIINVNFTPDTLAQREVVDKISDCLRKYGVQASQLGVEILEHSFGFDENETRILSALEKLDSQGHPIAVDDLGVGESNINRVKTLKQILTGDVPLTVKVDIRLTRLSEWAGSVPIHRSLGGVGMVFEGVSSQGINMINKQHDNLIRPRFQTFALYEPMSEEDALQLVAMGHEGFKKQVPQRTPVHSYY